MNGPRCVYCSKRSRVRGKRKPDNVCDWCWRLLLKMPIQSLKGVN